MTVEWSTQHVQSVQCAHRLKHNRCTALAPRGLALRCQLASPAGLAAPRRAGMGWSSRHPIPATAGTNHKTRQGAVSGSPGVAIGRAAANAVRNHLIILTPGPTAPVLGKAAHGLAAY